MCSLLVVLAVIWSQPLTEMIYAVYNEISEISDHDILLYDPKINCRGRCAVTINHFIYTFPDIWQFNTIGSVGTIWQFNTLTNKFITNNIPSIPHHAGYSCITADYDHNFIYLIGGVDGKGYRSNWQEIYWSNQMQVLNVITNQWLATADFNPTPVTFEDNSCEYYNGKIFAFGGITRVFGDYFSENNQQHDYIYKYDVAANLWTKLTQTLSTPRYSHTSVLYQMNQWVYIVGGSNSVQRHRTLSSVDIFNPETEQMEATYDELLFPRVFHGSVELSQRLYVFAGQLHCRYDVNGVVKKTDTVEISDVISLNPTSDPTETPTEDTIKVVQELNYH
eukprot:842586_1